MAYKVFPIRCVGPEAACAVVEPSISNQHCCLSISHAGRLEMDAPPHSRRAGATLILGAVADRKTRNCRTYLRIQCGFAATPQESPLALPPPPPPRRDAKKGEEMSPFTASRIVQQPEIASCCIQANSLGRRPTDRPTAP